MDYVLWEISHANLIMLMATIPKIKKEDGGKKKKSIEMDDIESIESFLNS